MERRITIPGWVIALYAATYAAIALIMLWAGAPLAAFPWAIVALIGVTIAAYAAMSTQAMSTRPAESRVERDAARYEQP